MRGKRAFALLALLVALARPCGSFEFSASGMLGFRNGGKQVLLVRERHRDSGEFVWNVPGGKRRRPGGREASPVTETALATAAREVAEETGGVLREPLVRARLQREDTRVESLRVARNRTHGATYALFIAELDALDDVDAAPRAAAAAAADPRRAAPRLSLIHI